MTLMQLGQHLYYFFLQKGAHLGQKATINLWYVDTRPNSQKLFWGIWRFVIFGLFKKKQLMFSYMFHSHNSNRPFHYSEYLPAIVKYSLLKRGNWIMEIKNITKHMLCFEFYKPNMTDLQMLGNSFCEFCLRIDIPTVGLKCLELPHFSTAFFSRRLSLIILKIF